MKKKLLISGCSFTQGGWVNNLPTEYFDITNLSMAAAGNKYIADSIIYHLSNPNDIDMVIVSWTSLTKIDKLVADSNYFSNYQWKKRVGNYDYVLSGGTIGTWLQNSLARLLFENDYKFSNLEIYGFNNLLEIFPLPQSRIVEMTK